jgi:hypothetical protein
MRTSLTDIQRAGLIVGTGFMALGIASCNQLTVAVASYDATATVSYTWQATYTPAGVFPDRSSDTRIEKFTSTSLVNHNGTRPGDAVTGPDEQGLWWPALPPKPSVDDLEARLQKDEQASSPELVTSVDYALTFEQGGETVTLPTNYEVYRQAVKAYPNQQALQLTLGPNDASVVNATLP